MKILAKIAVCALRVVYFIFKLFLKPGKKITFLSRQSNTLSIDFMLLQQGLQRVGCDKKIVMLCKKIPPTLIGKLGYAFHMLLQMYHIATSKVVVVDGYSIAVCVLKHNKQIKVVQIWHALSALKKFGYQSLGTKAGSSEAVAKILCMHKNYNYVLAPSEITAGYYKQAFGVDESQIKYIGIPRIDYILKEDKETAQKIYNEYPLLEKKQNIIYIPTFRKNQPLEIEEFIEKLDTEKYNLIVKLHPLDEITPRPQKSGVIYDSLFGVYDLAKVCDKIITDYSSLAMEVSLLEIPTYFYVYDIEEYKQSPGINFDFETEEMGIYKAETAKELLELLEKEYDKEILKRFKQKYITVDTNDCAKQLAEFITSM
ncbi:MAG: CDP-glycerol glycerophosphotransferase family protein [Ruminococcaceae bacterium]|nr:CDP-glycerol glycerophosphotransferase family protein [Oscillospiraceae bacterium]